MFNNISNKIFNCANIFGKVPGKISRQAVKRKPMLSKQGNKNFYKGKGAKKGGQITNRGKVTLYVAQFTIKNPFTIIAPDLTDFKLKPYVSLSTPKIEKSTK